MTPRSGGTVAHVGLVMLAFTCLLLAGPSVSAQAAKELGTLQWPDFCGPLVAFASDGQTLAAVTRIEFKNHRFEAWELKLLDVGTMKERVSFKGDGEISRIKFSPDGKTLALGFGGFNIHQPVAGKLTLWDVATGRKLATLPGHAGPVGGIAFTPDGKTLASGDGGVSGEAKLWDAVSGKELATFPGHRGEILSMALSPDGKLLAAGSNGGYDVKLWDVTTGKELDSVNGLTGWIALFTPDGKTLITTREGTITLWDVRAGKELRTLKMDGANYCNVALTADGKVLASAGSERGGDVKLWDLATGKELASLKSHAAGIGSLAFSADGKLLAAGGGTGNNWGGQVQLWDVSGVFSGTGNE